MNVNEYFVMQHPVVVLQPMFSSCLSSLSSIININFVLFFILPSKRPRPLVLHNSISKTRDILQLTPPKTKYQRMPRLWTMERKVPRKEPVRRIDRKMKLLHFFSLSTVASGAIWLIRASHG